VANLFDSPRKSRTWQNLGRGGPWRLFRCLIAAGTFEISRPVWVVIHLVPMRRHVCLSRAETARILH
jgi:hypothetical protein